MKARVILNSVDKAKDFVNATVGIDADMDLSSGRYMVDAKSIMGVFSLDLSKPVQFELHSGDKEIIAKVKEQLKEYIIVD